MNRLARGNEVPVGLHEEWEANACDGKPRMHIACSVGRINAALVGIGRSLRECEGDLARAAADGDALAPDEVLTHVRKTLSLN